MATPGSGSAAFQAPPNDLKPLAPFLQRAHETKTADPALSYWCNYHAAQLGIPLLSSLQPSSKAFLMQLMDTLEEQKKSMAGNDVVNGEDMVAKAYVENVALKVFAGADNEDRTGRANKATARRFLVASNFIEVLSNFGPLESDMEEKLKYSKWKAADIAKALREGRKPTPGAADDEVEEVQDQSNVEALTGTQEAASRLANLSATHPDKEQEYVDREMAKLTAGDQANEPASVAINTISPVDEPLAPSAARRAQSRLSYDAGAAANERESGEARSLGSPNFSRPLSTKSPSPQLDPQSALSHFAGTLSGGSSTPSSPRPLPLPPGSSHFRKEGLPIPPGGQGNTNPLIPPPHIASPGLPPANAYGNPGLPPTSGSNTPSSFFPSQPTIPPAPSHPSAPSAQAVTTNTSVSLPAPKPASPSLPAPTSLDPSSTARVQKLARWAISALDYDDLDTAKNHLREALDVCEGRVVAGKK